MRQALSGLVTLLLLTPFAAAQSVRLNVDAAGVARRNAPVVAMLSDISQPLPSGPATLRPADSGSGSEAVPAQIGNLGGGRIVVRWIEPNLAADEKKSYTLTPGRADSGVDGDATGRFSFAPGDGWRDLLFAGQPIVRQMTRYDSEDHANTFKPFDHVYDLHRGEQFITKGPGGQFTHHRGIFFGFNRTNYGDFWHCPDVSQRHVGFAREREWAGPLAAKAVSLIDWVGKDGQAKFRDTREVVAWRVSDDEIVLDYEITLETLTGAPEPVGGDAHHAGFHFRASNELADSGDKNRRGGGVHYVLPQSAKLLKNDIWADAPWVNASFELFGRRYSITHMNAPTNPDPTTYSTRGYGRFGAFCTSEVTPDKPLKLNYRLVIRDITDAATTQPAQSDLAAAYESFVEPVRVEVE